MLSNKKIYAFLNVFIIQVLLLQNLKTLRLNGCQKISKQFYQNFLPLFDKLQVLDFSNTSAGDTCLFILGAYCKDLRYSDHLC